VELSDDSDSDDEASVEDADEPYEDEVVRAGVNPRPIHLTPLPRPSSPSTAHIMPTKDSQEHQVRHEASVEDADEPYEDEVVRAGVKPRSIHLTPLPGPSSSSTPHIMPTKDSPSVKWMRDVYVVVKILVMLAIAYVMSRIPKTTSSVEMRAEHSRSVAIMTVNGHNTGEYDFDPFGPDYVTYDTGSSLHLAKSKKHAANVKDCIQKSFNGIMEGSEGGVYNQTCTFLEECFGRVAFAPNSTANIFAQTVARDQGHQIQYDYGEDTFTVISTAGNKYRYGRMITSNWGHLSAHYVMDIRTRRPPAALPLMDQTPMSALRGAAALLTRPHLTAIPTVAANLSKYSNKEVMTATKALRFLDCMGQPPQKVAFEQLQGMRNAPVSREDIARAFDIWGDALAGLRGRTTKRSNSAATYPDKKLTGTQLQQDQSAEVDIMWIRKQPYLAVTLTPLDFSFAITLTDKQEDTIVRALETAITKTLEQGFRIKWVRSDGEPAMGTAQVARILADSTIELDIVSSGGHAHTVERRIRFIKEKYRTIENGLPYAMPRKIQQGRLDPPGAWREMLL
jgi:hypothetical protein